MELCYLVYLHGRNMHEMICYSSTLIWENKFNWGKKNLRACLVPIFKNCFLFSKTKRRKHVRVSSYLFIYFLL